jgi:hypothetical protein
VRTLEIPKGSVEHVTAVVTGEHLNAAGLDISVSATTYTWQAAEWDGAASTSSRKIRTTSPVTFSTAGTYRVYVRLTDSPEAPIVLAGQITVKE